MADEKETLTNPLSSHRVTSSPGHLVSVALVGNPNTGKTTLFNALAGMRQRVGNYPGVTVETKKGPCSCQGGDFDLIDLPGTYSLAARSPDEMVAVDVILGQQVGESREAVGDGVQNFLLRRLLLDVGGYTEKRLVQQVRDQHLSNGNHASELESLVKSARQRLAEAGCSVPAIEAKTRYPWIREVTAGCIHRPAQRLVTWTDRLDRILMHKGLGTGVFLVLIFGGFQSIFTLG